MCVVDTLSTKITFGCTFSERDVLVHPWAHFASGGSDADLTAAQKALRKYNAHRKMQRIARGVIATRRMQKQAETLLAARRTRVAAL